MTSRLKRSTSGLSTVGTLRVSAKPRAGRDEVLGLRSGLLLVSVTAAAEGGKANGALTRVLADAFGVPKSTVSVVRGTSARTKTVEFATLSDEAIATMVQRYETI